jgi:hypothetical protein
MSSARLSPLPLDFSVYAQLRAHLGSASALEAAKPAHKLLAELAASAFSRSPASAPRTILPLPQALERLASKLGELGVQASDMGQVIKQLRSLIGDRGVNPANAQALRDAVATHTGSLPSGGGTDYVSGAASKYLSQLSPEQRAMWQLQQAASRQNEAAALMAALEKASNDAGNAIVQKIA